MVPLPKFRSLVYAETLSERNTQTPNSTQLRGKQRYPAQQFQQNTIPRVKLHLTRRQVARKRSTQRTVTASAFFRRP